MATVKKCDMCGNMMADLEMNNLTTFLEYKCRDQHDGEYKDRRTKIFDLCDKCTSKIVKKIPGQDPDAVIVRI